MTSRFAAAADAGQIRSRSKYFITPTIRIIRLFTPDGEDPKVCNIVHNDPVTVPVTP